MPALPRVACNGDEPSDILAPVDATSSYDAVRGQEREIFDMVHPPDPGFQVS
jgi:hypothetical protein